ncbi:MAG TPA: 6,7-dimethyl-8-ribityllumazine synthase [Actinomycetota bacterium]|nr:6,7-dimethyl-8-ribityllumazine synthase [Actinomycetota bacterium]
MRRLQGGRDGSGLRVGVIVSRFNERVTEALLKGALEALAEVGVPDDGVTVVSVPGAFELPGAASRLASSGTVDTLVCLGAVIRGDTEHFTFVAAAAQEGILRVVLDTGIPVTFGVLTTEDVGQAEDRSGGPDGTRAGNKGYEVALDAVEMANLYRLLGTAAPALAKPAG